MVARSRTNRVFLGALVSILPLAFSGNASAAGRSGGGGGGFSSLSGNSSIGLAIGTTSPSQDDLNNAVDAINSIPGRNAGKLGSGLEFSIDYEYRYSGEIYALALRPSYMTQNGKGSTDSINLTGLMFFPMLRLYPLENDFIHFYMQIGMGFGQLSGDIKQPGGDVKFSGSAFGTQAGLGAQFFFTPGSCLFFEGDFRYLPIDRSLVSSTGVNPASGFSQTGNGQELEVGGHDVGTTFSGIVGMIGYRFSF